MDLQHRLVRAIDTKRRERATSFALSRLGDRQLADFGLAREDIRRVARLAARDSGRHGDVPVAEIVRLLKEDPAAARYAEGPVRHALKRRATAAGGALTALFAAGPDRRSSGGGTAVTRALAAQGSAAWGLRESR